MRKKLQFCISMVMVILIACGSLVFPASSYENTVNTSSDLILLMNLDTQTPVYTKSASKKWYMGYLGEMMTFIVAAQAAKGKEDQAVKIKKGFVESLDYSDGCLKKFYGKKLTVKDLLGIMLYSTGSDAAWVLANYCSKGNVDKFVSKMNQKAKELKCKSTNFTTPGFDYNREQLTSCHDLYKIYAYAMKLKVFQQISEKPTFIPQDYEEESYKIPTKSSIRIYGSPYYFRYVDSSKYSYASGSKEALIATTNYNDSHYLFVALRGKKKSEANVYVDCKQLTTWAYLNLSDKKLLSPDEVIATVDVDSDWNRKQIDLVVASAEYRTVPNDFTMDEFNTMVDVPETVKMPIFAGQNIGTARIYHDTKVIDEIGVVASSSAGVSMVEDLRSFCATAVDAVMPEQPQEETEAASESEESNGNYGDFES